MLKVRTRCLHLGHFQRCEFGLLIGISAFVLFVFVVIFWLEPFTAIFEPKILNSPRFFKLVLCSTTGGQHVQMFLTHCRTFMSYFKPSFTD